MKETTFDKHIRLEVECRETIEKIVAWEFWLTSDERMWLIKALIDEYLIKVRQIEL